jgi:hypothetical protein
MASLKYPLKTASDIIIEISEEQKTLCQICCKKTVSPNALAGHVGAKHKIKFEDYLVKYYMDDKHPLCPKCSAPTRYLRGEYVFKKYCTTHANESRKEWSINKGFGHNGFDHGWRDGLTKNTSPSIAKQAEKISGKNNPSFLSKEQFLEKLLVLKQNNILLDITYDKYSSNHQPVKAKCNICQKNIIKKFCNLIDSPKCSSCASGKSSEEQEVYNFVLSIEKDAIRNARDVIKRELDIFCKDKNFAIEYNGLFWHTEDKVGKNYHNKKSEACREKNIKIMQIFSDEWKNNSQIVKSMIKYRLGYSEKKIYARKCVIKETTTNKVLEPFFDSTHISGHTLYTKAFYLEDPSTNEIIAALSFRRPFIKKYGANTIEIARFSTKLNTSVPGGFSRLLKKAKEWAKSNGYSRLLTYADLRFGTGNVYLQNGFSFVGKTVVDYWYTDGKNRFNRFQYRAADGKSEKKVTEEAGVKKIYGCGSNIYEFIL